MSVGSIPTTPKTIAQVVEQYAFNVMVQGSSPCGPRSVSTLHSCLFIFFIVNNYDFLDFLFQKTFLVFYF